MLPLFVIGCYSEASRAEAGWYEIRRSVDPCPDTRKPTVPIWISPSFLLACGRGLEACNHHGYQLEQNCCALTKSGQAASVMGLEVHVKDESRFQGKWAFFGFPKGKTTAKMVAQTEDCYSCHADHGAVDTTFVQFYPTLMPLAREKGTLAASYVKKNAR